LRKEEINFFQAYHVYSESAKSFIPTENDCPDRREGKGKFSFASE
jgi:hypothetical protein